MHICTYAKGEGTGEGGGSGERGTRGERRGRDWEGGEGRPEPNRPGVVESVV
jgi:hypothetical protein